MKIVGLPALTETYENYIWIIHDDHQAWIVDPGESEQVIAYLSANQLTPKGVLITHYHHDHVNGVPNILTQYPNIMVYGPEKSDLPFIKKRLSGGDDVSLTPSLAFKVVETPGHTLDQIAFYNDLHLFCGDALFTGGCGRLLGGTAAQFASTLLKLRDLSDELEFYCGHEYTTTNLQFAQLVDPNNQALDQRIKETKINYPSLHFGAQSTLGLEKKTNPFLRLDHPDIKPQLIARGAEDSPEGLFLALRRWKDEFDRRA